MSSTTRGLMCISIFQLSPPSVLKYAEKGRGVYPCQTIKRQNKTDTQLSTWRPDALPYISPRLIAHIPYIRTHICLAPHSSGSIICTPTRRWLRPKLLYISKSLPMQRDGQPHYTTFPAMPMNKACTARLKVQNPTFFNRLERLC
jgi:hypothetical protein